VFKGAAIRKVQLTGQAMAKRTSLIAEHMLAFKIENRVNASISISQPNF
jgi:hypothetical protein